MDLLEENSLTPEEALGHWYYGAKFALLSGHLRAIGADAAAGSPTNGRIADLGCGLGIFLRLLRRAGHPPEALVGVDSGLPATTTDPAYGFTLHPHWPGQERFETILMMDVLEHCPDDAGVLQEATDHLAPGGHVFITVPAFRWLWSSHDVFLKHCRRYSCMDLRALVAREPRLEIEELHYFYGLLFPLALMQRLRHRYDRKPGASQLKKLPAPLNALFLAICRCETAVMRLNRLAGLTAVVRCRLRQPAGSGG